MPTFSQQVNWATVMWRSNVARPYILAYNEAYKAVQASLKKEEDNAKAQAELFVSIVAILPTSVLMAVIATPSFRRAIQKIGVRRLGADNLRVALSYLKADGKHPAVAFAFGKLAGMAKDKGGTAISTMLTNLVRNTSAGVTANDPLSRSQELLGLVDTQGMMVERVGTAIMEDPQMNAGQKKGDDGRLDASAIFGEQARKENGLAEATTVDRTRDADECRLGSRLRFAPRSNRFPSSGP
ncbi:hypothetical protein [Sphingomonas pseudosanguinis]|uniref:Uncharacterized protein n=1 Tax=Sphingomonas pseudosanguinis TaxID=413712 RepID=A0A7W6ABT2_9SPHN|nr:hypothetical protein [Sphingomonas pseudosanguinis]MBB3880982.1 hypothetical protein [Sphingomonas pseudosanguinis]MBN3535434.1 hypothetical protein [Sphingomonas pseudosanguinis]